jgi:dUTP pyrophosphatase
MDTVTIRVQRTTEAAALPRVMQQGDVAADLTAAADVTIPARGRALVSTGLVLELPEGFRARIHSRSGLSLKHGIEAGAGLIDQGYRHPVGVLLYNHSDQDFPVAAGDRIAQLCIERYTHPLFEEVAEVAASERTAGWGSSGQN